MEPCADQNGPITGYSVRYGTETMSVAGDSGGGMTTISGLTQSTTYSIQVAAENNGLIGPYSTAVNQLTEGMCSESECWYTHTVAVPVVMADTTTATSISLSWTTGGSESVSYTVVWQRDTSGDCSDVNEGFVSLSGGSMTMYDIPDLEEDSTYSITVTATNTRGSEMSVAISANTLRAGEY